jgi:hypothetical protein
VCFEAIIEIVDVYSKLDHAALVRNLNAVCKELGDLLDSAGLYCGPPALTLEDIQEKLPDALHSIAVRAGWIEKPVEVELVDPEKVEIIGPEELEIVDPGSVPALLGNCVVEESYKNWFLHLVEGTLADLRERAVANKPAQDRDYKRLTGQFAKGKKPTVVRKRYWPDNYEDGTETPKGIFDRRRKAMHWEWDVLHNAVEKEWIKREKRRRSDQGLESPGKLAFSIDSLYSIRRGDSHPLPQRKLEAVAAIISLPGNGKPIPHAIPWTALRWRNEFRSNSA